MIYTITLNPAIDKIILMSQDLELKKTNYYHDEYSVVGGKGINVGVVLNNLNEDVQLTGILGKNNPDVFEKKFEILELKNHFFANDGNTRTNYKIKNLKTNQETELNGEGFRNGSRCFTTTLAILIGEHSTARHCGRNGQHSKKCAKKYLSTNRDNR
jgi:1-phosphofructokinase